MFDAKSLYQKVEDALIRLNQKYPDMTRLVNIGETHLGRDIKAIRIGKGSRSILINAAHHGREYATTILTMNQIEFLLDAYSCGRVVEGYDVRCLLVSVSIWFFSLVNPDGVEIAKGTIDIPLVSRAGISRVQWKANGRGVDLNRNYPAEWETVRDAAKQPGPRYYKGTAPFSENETKAIEAFIREQDFDMVLCYHSSGRHIYWYFNQSENYRRDFSIAEELGKITGYSIEQPKGIYTQLKQETVEQQAVLAGMKDWFIQDFKRPGFTLEIGRYEDDDAVPGYEQYDEIWEENKKIPLHLISLVYRDIKPALPSEAAVSKTEEPRGKGLITGVSIGKIINQVEYNQNKQSIEIYRQKRDGAYSKVIDAPVSTGTIGTPTPNGWFTVKAKRLMAASDFLWQLPNMFTGISRRVPLLL